MLRCASSFVIAAYEKVRLTPQDSRALPAELFTKPSNLACFLTFYEFIKGNLCVEHGRMVKKNAEDKRNVRFKEVKDWGRR
ncbi:MAG: hypothetical protein COX51_07120 [Syntrophobacteraceae bacterium CG23_combo_of_CG06-09_8_20_14_all_50_8]|nr:MAG: hypothetical protein COX51_07120 [Syntrophobacteraceae bacterium CG23_combo_of_CG06-09_8_20_14_all_50_8]